jgi:hypothetical protein
MKSLPRQSGNRPRYLAGLWRADLELQLGWKANGTAIVLEFPETPPLMVPSWSWASVSHGTTREHVGTNLKLVNCHVTLDTLDEFGAVKDGFIELMCQPLVLIAISRERKANDGGIWYVQLMERDGEHKQATAVMDHPGKTADKEIDLFALPVYKYCYAFGRLILQSVQRITNTYRRVGVFRYKEGTPSQEDLLHPLRANLGAMMTKRIRIV